MPPSICLSARGHARIASAVRFCYRLLRTLQELGHHKTAALLRRMAVLVILFRPHVDFLLQPQTALLLQRAHRGDTFEVGVE